MTDIASSPAATRKRVPGEPSPSASSDERLVWQIPSATESGRPVPAELGAPGPNPLASSTAVFLLLALGAALVITALAGMISLLAALGLLVPIAFAWWLFSRLEAARLQASNAGEICLDRDGVHWRDDWGVGHSFVREDILSFRVGLDPDTWQVVPALTLLLTGGWESQPMVIFAPATPANVRKFLQDQLDLIEQPWDDSAYGERLRESVEQDLRSLGSVPLAQRLLHSLANSLQWENDAWRIAEISLTTAIEYDPRSCRFLVQDSSRQHAFSDLGEVVSFLQTSASQHEDKHWRLQNGDFDAQSARQAAEQQGLLVEPFSELEDWDEDESIKHFRVPVPASGSPGCVERVWRLSGARNDLESLCQAMDAMGRAFQPPPLGARPHYRHWGSGAMRVKMEVGRDWYHDHFLVRLPPKRWVELADAIRRRLSTDGDQYFWVYLVDAESEFPQAWAFQVAQRALSTEH